MEQLLITSSEELCQWLNKWNWFTEQYIRDLRSFASFSWFKFKFAAVSFISSQYKNWWHISCRRKKSLRSFILEATGVEEWTCLSYFDKTQPGYIYIEELNLPNSDNKIKLEIDSNFKLTCTEIKITDLGELIAINSPRLSNRELVINVYDHDYPKPKDWIEWFAAVGCEVVWRRLGDKAVTPEQVPQIDYIGWFLQKPENIDQTKYGLMFSACRKADYGFRTIFELSTGETTSEMLWLATGGLTKLFPEVSVQCGNCKFTGATWADCLKSKEPNEYIMNKFIPLGTPASDLI